jgi:hypothetical protein
MHIVEKSQILDIPAYEISLKIYYNLSQICLLIQNMGWNKYLTDHISIAALPTILKKELFHRTKHRIKLRIKPRIKLRIRLRIEL